MCFLAQFRDERIKVACGPDQRRALHAGYGGSCCRRDLPPICPQVFHDSVRQLGAHAAHLEQLRACQEDGEGAGQSVAEIQQRCGAGRLWTAVHFGGENRVMSENVRVCNVVESLIVREHSDNKFYASSNDASS